MDAPTLTWLQHNVLPLHATGKRVLEVGSLNVNGSIRGHVERLEPASYVGVDVAAGPGVDCIVSAHGLTDWIGHGVFDLVISTEMLEHVKDWRHALNQLKAVLAPGGTIVLTTRRPGFPRHCHPDDHWRFTAQILRLAFRDFRDVVCQNVLGQGVVLRASKPKNWTPARLVVIDARPAPAYELSPFLLRIWAKAAYLGQDPAAREVPA